MKRAICLIAVVLLMGLMACQGKQNDPEPAGPGTISAGSTLQANGHSSWQTWEKVHDDLHKTALAESLQVWEADDGQERMYVINVGEEEERIYTVHYRNENHWELNAVSEDEPLFSLENKGGKITLQHGSAIRNISEKEVALLLPVYHIQLLHEAVKHRQYEYVSFSPSKAQWQVDFSLPGQVISDFFTKYLTAHLDVPWQASLADFSVKYQLLIDEKQGDWQIKGFTFQLQKHGYPLETLHFDLRKEVNLNKQRIE
ncbi:hypothetical protein GCM10010965_16670 [Caldalkalibacillus thermarum]|uniref:hypothetical protein n=1 Tax=Caldalkalibacillus thermarum TaxID=296745 RepID=UPI0016676CF2|nr:hypothetical protein [Caldalkalibacillus thermarum]GGK24568.1 hypothetical protein GCM10010965_16670 [Caldalkalibacillus thermarum]